jgi:2-keto-4-pentenoate hydratase/2-oxohepta-3-ene-1,7-dioic acid hydratase in catechol pathway
MLFKRTLTNIDLFGTLIPEPRVFFDFLGFEKHVKQYREKRGAPVPPRWYDHASYYAIDLPPEKLFGPGDAVTVPKCTQMADYEFEIGLIITEDGLLTSFAEAMQFFKEKCFITIVNDWSARDIQMVDMEGLGPTNSKLIIGKSCGPKIIPVSALDLDEAGVFSMVMKARVNGELRCDSNYRSIYHINPKTGIKSAWSFPRILQFLGEHNVSVHPGYWIGSGTVGDGSIGEFRSKIDLQSGIVTEAARYPWLRDGDVVELEAEGIGTLSNRVIIS